MGVGEESWNGGRVVQIDSITGGRRNEFLG